MSKPPIETVPGGATESEAISAAVQQQFALRQHKEHKLALSQACGTASRLRMAGRQVSRRASRRAWDHLSARAALCGLIVCICVGSPNAHAAVDRTGCTVPNGAAVFSGPPRGGKVSVTFDESLGSYTADILKSFRTARMTGSFYVVGTELRAHRQLTRDIVKAGHEIGNHSWDHSDLTQLSNGGYENLRRARRAIVRIADFRPCTMRPPNLANSESVVDSASSLGMRTVLASRGNDIFGLPPPQVCSYALDSMGGIVSGEIILMHQTQGSAAALPCVLAGLRDLGLRSVPVAKLLGGSWLRGRLASRRRAPSTEPKGTPPFLSKR